MDCVFKQQKCAEDKAESESDHCQLALGWQTEKLCLKISLEFDGMPWLIYASFPEHLCVVFGSLSFSGIPRKDGSEAAPHQEETKELRVLENL